MSNPPELKLNRENNPGNARWCDMPGHKRLECAKRRSKGRGDCHAPAIQGTDACRIHAGHTTAVAVAKGQARISAWSAVGMPRDGQGIDASAAVLGMLQQSWLRANLYSQLLQLQVTKDGDGDALGENQFDPERPVEAGGLIGFRYGAAGKDGNIYAVSEEARALVGLEAAERDRVVKYAKTAHDMGISERMIGMAERWGDQVVNRLMAILGGLNLTREQEAMVPTLIQAHLGSIELGS
jgi:hypothetical protein